MQPDSQLQQQPAPQQPTDTAKKSIRLPLFLMLWPIGFFVLTFLIYALLNLFMQDPVAADGSVTTNPLKTALNIVIFLMGAGAVVFGPVSFIIGIVLLVRRKSK